MSAEEERFFESLRRSGVDEYSARSAAGNCARALNAARLKGVAIGGLAGGVAGFLATSYVGGVAAPAGAVIGGAAGAFLKSQSAWSSQSCEEVRDAARSLSGVGMDPYDILPFPMR